MALLQCLPGATEKNYVKSQVGQMDSGPKIEEPTYCILKKRANH